MSAAARHCERIIDRDVAFYADDYEQQREALRRCNPYATERAQHVRLCDCAEQVVLALMRYRNAIDAAYANHPTKDKP